MAGRGTRSYDVVHRDPRFDLAYVSYLHNSPSGDPAAAGNLAVLTRLPLVSFGKVHACAGEVQVSPPPQKRVVMKLHLLLQFRMILKEKGCV